MKAHVNRQFIREGIDSERWLRQGLCYIVLTQVVKNWLIRRR